VVGRPRGDGEKCPGNLCIHPCLPFLYGDDHPSLPIFRCSPRTPGHLTHTGQPKNSFSIPDFVHFRSNFITAFSLPSLECFDIKRDFDCSDGIFHPKCTSCVFGGVMAGFKEGFFKRGRQPPLGATEWLSGGHEQRPSLGSFTVILHNPTLI